MHSPWPSGESKHGLLHFFMIPPSLASRPHFPISLLDHSEQSHALQTFLIHSCSKHLLLRLLCAAHCPRGWWCRDEMLSLKELTASWGRQNREEHVRQSEAWSLTPRVCVMISSWKVLPSPSQNNTGCGYLDSYFLESFLSFLWLTPTHPLNSARMLPPPARYWLTS